MESLFKLKESGEEYKVLSIAHNMTKKEHEVAKLLFTEAKDKNQRESGDFKWRVRGLPDMLKLVRVKVH